MTQNHFVGRQNHYVHTPGEFGAFGALYAVTALISHTLTTPTATAKHKWETTAGAKGKSRENEHIPKNVEFDIAG